MPLISVSLALDSLREAVTTVDTKREELERARAERDELIRDARDAKVPARTLGRITGLSREHINTIANQRPKGVSVTR